MRTSRSPGTTTTGPTTSTTGAWPGSPQMFQQFMEWMGMMGKGGGKGQPKGGMPVQIILDERHFRKLKVYDGTFEKYRMWMFHFLVALGRVDGRLAGEIRKLLPRVLDDKWSPTQDAELDQEIYNKYKEELYGVLVDHTDGTASAVVEAVVSKGFGEDGFTALADLSQRFDSKTAASRLAAFLDVVNPKPITNCLLYTSPSPRDS